MRMSTFGNQNPRPGKAQQRLQRQNRVKAARTAVQLLVLAALITVITISIIHSVQNGAGSPGQGAPASGQTSGTGGNGRFIALSYPGLTKSTRQSGSMVQFSTFEAQLAALKAAGYQSVSQKDIVNFYLSYGALPDKALFLLFEDGLKSTTSLAQDTLLTNGYQATVSTYANLLTGTGGKYLTGADLQTLLAAGCWEAGTGGYRLSYINVFDRYRNFIGPLNADEFRAVRAYLGHDYNHILMDFNRDADRLRTETPAELTGRIGREYENLRSTYTLAMGSVPQLYLLMHANTGAFGNDALASDANRDNILSLFKLNFNREGTCLNTLASSVYDLSRLQVRGSFSTNHLLMRIRDDTGDPIPFVTGDTAEAAHWYSKGGAAEYSGNRIVLTTDPGGVARLTLKPRLFSDLELNVTLEGNPVGRQSVYLRTDRNLTHGIEVALEDDAVEVRDVSAAEGTLYRGSLLSLAAGAALSTQEDEYNGQVALQNAILQFDTDAARVAQAREKLKELENTAPQTLADGGSAYVPVNTEDSRGTRSLRIRLVGARLSLWIDGRLAVDQLKVPGLALGAVGLGAQVYQNRDGAVERALSDDVYDAVFTDLSILDAQNPNTALYLYRLTQEQSINSVITGWFNAVIDFFVDHF